jgi:hypothetical protein
VLLILLRRKDGKEKKMKNKKGKIMKKINKKVRNKGIFD